MRSSRWQAGRFQYLFDKCSIWSADDSPTDGNHEVLVGALNYGVDPPNCHRPGVYAREQETNDPSVRAGGGGDKSEHSQQSVGSRGGGGGGGGMGPARKSERQMRSKS